MQIQNMYSTSDHRPIFTQYVNHTYIVMFHSSAHIDNKISFKCVYWYIVSFEPTHMHDRTHALNTHFVSNYSVPRFLHLSRIYVHYISG